MSGMLPGVECARRRRFHNSASSRDSTNRSFSLYARNLLSPLSSSSLLERNILIQPCPHENLGGAAREAKRRLDQKFMAHLKFENKHRPPHKRKGLFHCLWRQLRP